MGKRRKAGNINPKKQLKKTGNCLLQQRTGNQLFIKQFYKCCL